MRPPTTKARHARRSARPLRARVRVVALTPSPGAPAPPAAAAAAAVTPAAEMATAPPRLVPDGVLAPLASPPLTGGDGGEPPSVRPTGGGGDGEGEAPSDGGWNLWHRLVLGVRARVAADPDFAFKIAVECGLDAAIILCVNAAARGSRLLADADLVASQVAVSLLNDCALVYLLAPRRGGAAAASSRRFTRVAARLPAHVFQAGPFSPAARAGCFGVRALQYGALGAVSGVVRGGTIEALTTARAAADPTFTPPPTWAPPLATGGVLAYFMTLLSNARYNLVNGAEAAVASAAPGSAKAATIALRLANNWAGASHFMHVADRLRLNRPRPGVVVA